MLSCIGKIDFALAAWLSGAGIRLIHLLAPHATRVRRDEVDGEVGRAVALARGIPAKIANATTLVFARRGWLYRDDDDVACRNVGSSAFPGHTASFRPMVDGVHAVTTNNDFDARGGGLDLW